MERDPNQSLNDLRTLLNGIKFCARKKNAARCQKLLDRVLAWGRERMAAPPDAQAEMGELRQKLHASRTAFEATVNAYKDLLDTFDIFRSSIDVIQQVKRIDELPEAMKTIRGLRSMPSLHLVLDEDLFGADRPPDFGWAAARLLRERMLPFTPAPRWPLLHLGDIQSVEDPSFFLGLDHEPMAGSCFILALRHKYQTGTIIGFLSAYDPDPRRYGPDKATDFLGHFSDILACTLINAQEHAQLEELSVRDPLTGANNRAYLERHAPRILEFATRRAFPVHLFFIDLNGFKAVNDTLGHDAGDIILIRVVQTIQAMIRAYDIFVRLGGDEFVILLPDTDESMARAFLGRLQTALAGIEAHHGQNSVPPVSASVGMARHQAGQTLDDLLREADRLMYAAKLHHSEPRGPRGQGPHA